MSDEHENIAETVSYLAQLASEPFTPGDSDIPLLALPVGSKVESLEQYLPIPSRVKRDFTAGSEESFIHYVDRWKGPHSAIFADGKNRKVVAILDEHVDAGAPSWCSHKATYPCLFSRQWRAWAERDGKEANQGAFLEFVEDHLDDFKSPGPMEMLQIIAEFRVVRRQSFGSSQVLSSGEVDFTYSNLNNTEESIKVPEIFEIGIPVFERGPRYKVKVRLRYRITEGKLSLWYQIIDPDRYIEDAFEQVCETIHAGKKSADPDDDAVVPSPLAGLQFYYGVP